MFIFSDFSTQQITEWKFYIEKHKLRDISIGCGVPIFNPKTIFDSAISSLLLQKTPCLIFVSDDDSEQRGNIEDFLLKYSESPNVIFFQNPVRIGQLKNTKLVRDFFLKEAPWCEFYFLGSDHDVWHPNFSLELKKSLEESTVAAMAFPETRVLNYNSDLFPEKRDLFLRHVIHHESNQLTSTEGLELLRATPYSQSKNEYGKTMASKFFFLRKRLRAGNMIYGMEKLQRNEKIPYYEPVLGPDRLFLFKVLANSSVIQVKQELWMRIQFSSHNRERQLRNLFVNQRTPSRLYIRFPDIHHAQNLLLDKSLPRLYRYLIFFEIIMRMIMKKSRKTIKPIKRTFISFLKRVQRMLNKAIRIVKKFVKKRVKKFVV